MKNYLQFKYPRYYNMRSTLSSRKSRFNSEKQLVQEKLTTVDHVFRVCVLIVWIFIWIGLMIFSLHK